MGFNYAKERRLFIKEWKTIAKQYRMVGFTNVGIQKMFEFDWAWFKLRRTYENRTQAFPVEKFGDDDNEIRSKLFMKFPSLTDWLEENDFSGRYDWIETVSDTFMLGKLIKLSDDDKELLTLLAFDGYTQSEIAVIKGCSQQAVSKKIKKIKKFLK